MKISIIAAAVLMAYSGAAFAAGPGFETSRMEGGLKFAEMQTESRLNSSPEPVRLEGSFAPVEKAGINAEAKDYTKLSVKAPPALKAEAEETGKKSGRKAEIVGAVVGAVALGVVGAAMLAACPMEVAGAAAVLTVYGAVAVVSAVGGAIGYGVVHGVRGLLD